MTELRSWPAVLEHLQTNAGRMNRGKHAWSIYRTTDAGRVVFYGRPKFWLNGLPFDPLHRKHYLEECCCVRCGGGRSRAQWTFPPAPTLFDVGRWITLCFRCLGYWIWLWPETFTAARLAALVPKPHFPKMLGWGATVAEKDASGMPLALDALWYERRPFGPRPTVVPFVPAPGDLIRNR